MRGWMLGAALLLAQPVLAQVGGDDGESASRFFADTPPGPWAGALPHPPGFTLEAAPSAAHRGSQGLQLLDTSAPDGLDGTVGGINTPLTDTPEKHLRAWMRLDALSGHYIFPLNLAGTVPSNTMLELRLYGPTGTPTVFGFDVNQGGNETPAGADLGVGQWHRLEMIVRGVGTPDGRQELWVDGEQRASASGLDWTGARLNTLTVGEPWAQDAFEGAISFDDVQWSDTDLAAQVVMTSAASAPMRGCIPVGLQLQSDAGMPTQAPYPLPLS